MQACRSPFPDLIPAKRATDHPTMGTPSETEHVPTSSSIADAILNEDDASADEALEENSGDLISWLDSDLTSSQDPALLPEDAASVNVVEQPCLMTPKTDCALVSLYALCSSIYLVANRVFVVAVPGHAEEASACSSRSDCGRARRLE